MPTQLGQLGMQAAGAATGGIMGIAFGGIQNSQQYNQQKRLNTLNKDMIDYQKMKELEMWKATNYGAQVAELNKAGLNPGLLYGMSGGGGTTTGGSGGGNATASPQQGGIMGMQMGAQAALIAAQTENVKADTEKKKVETTKTAGVDTTLTEAQGKHTNLQNEWQGIQNAVARMTMKEAMTTIENNALKSQEELEIMARNNQLDAAQYKDKIKQLKVEIIGATLKNGLTQAQTTNTNQETKNKIQEILESEHRIRAISGQLAIAWDRLGLDTERTHSEMLDKLMEENELGFLKDIMPEFFVPLNGIIKRIGPTPNKVGFK